MRRQYCPRCGLESHHSQGGWHDRRPTGAVVLTVIMLAMAVTHLWLFGVAAVGGALYFTHRERRRREALAARADYEHRRLMASAVFEPQWPRGFLPAPVKHPAARHVLTQWPTTPMPTQPIRRNR